MGANEDGDVVAVDTADVAAVSNDDGASAAAAATTATTDEPPAVDSELGARIDALVALLDADGNGAIDHFELERVMEVVYMPPASEECSEMDRMFYFAKAARKAAYMTRNGPMPNADMVAVLTKIASSEEPEQREMFAAIERVALELDRTHKPAAADTHARVNAILAKWDFNHDGLMSYDELATVLIIIGTGKVEDKSDAAAVAEATAAMQERARQMTSNGPVPVERLQAILRVVGRSNEVGVDLEDIEAAIEKLRVAAIAGSKQVAAAADDDSDGGAPMIDRQPSAPSMDEVEAAADQQQQQTAASSMPTEAQQKLNDVMATGVGKLGLTDFSAAAATSAAPPVDRRTAYLERVRRMEQEEAAAMKDSDSTLGKRMRYYSAKEVAQHSVYNDCWVSFFGAVYDLTKLIEGAGVLAEPIQRFAGQDISHWFDPRTKEPKQHIDPKLNVVTHYTPYGRYIHIPPNEPTADWSTDFELPWWRDPQYLIGNLSTRMRTIRVINTLSGHDDTLDVCAEETMEEIRERYLKYNTHARSYIWKRLGRPLNMTKTLEENGIVDQSEQFDELLIDADTYLPALHLYFNDDMS